MTKLQAHGDFLYGPADVAAAEEGLTKTVLRTEQLDDTVVRDIVEGKKKLRHNGGQGQDGVALIGEAVLTVKETAAVKIAVDMIGDAERRHRKSVRDLTLLELNEGVEARVEGRACTAAEVMAEIGRLQNQATYGDRVVRC